MVGEPRMRTQRDPAGEHDLVGAGHLDPGVQQRVVRGFEPVAGSLERIGRQVDPPTAQDRCPVHVDAVHVCLGQGQQYPPLAAVVAQQRADHGGVLGGLA